LVVAAYGVADAQTEGATHPDTSVGVEKQVQLSPQDELTQSDSMLARMSVSTTNVRRQLEQARAQRDVVKTLCLNDKLNQIDVAERSARDRRSSLEQAVNRHDVDLSNHEFTILTVLRQRVEQLGAEANQCIGEDQGFVGESRVTTTIDPGIPQQDPSEYPTYPIFSVPPVCVSCLK
jgi:hypothetical protein